MYRKTSLQQLIISVWLLLDVSSAFGNFRLRDILNPKEEVVLSSEKNYDSYSDVEVHYVTQPLDHFSPNSPTTKSITFQQRYFSSNRFVVSNDDDKKKKPAYAFLCVGGEGPGLTKAVLVDSVHCTGDLLELAQHLSETADVYLFALEHRYYGHSYPKIFSSYSNNSYSSALEIQNLMFLSSKQAVEDIASFVVRQQEESVPAATKWVTFGGSYPGFLSAMARQLHPELIHAAVSSSAPVRFVLDFKGYKEHQAFDLKYSKIGGSEECLRIVQEGHVEIANEIDAGNVDTVGKLFGLCSAQQLLENTYNLGLFLGDGAVLIPAQGNDPSCKETEICNLQHVCEFLIAPQHQQQSMSNMERLGALARKQQQGYDGCTVIDWNQTLVELSNTTVDPDGDNWRSWLWQTCTEFGYYQTCPKDSNCPFGRGYHNIDMDYDICQVAFHLSPRAVQNNVDATTTYYEGAASRILSVNGDVDPWSELAVVNSTDSKQLPAYMVQGASHHFWTHPLKDTDGAEIQKARTMIYHTVMEWLEHDTATIAVAIQ